MLMLHTCVLSHLSFFFNLLFIYSLYASVCLEPFLPHLYFSKFLLYIASSSSPMNFVSHYSIDLLNLTHTMFVLKQIQKSWH